MFEQRKQPLLPRREFYRRLRRYAAGAFLLVAVSLLIGIFGYREFEGMSFIDSLLNAAMILGGMGPVDTLHTNAGKLFASFYSLFSGIVFLVSVGVLLAPILHRFFHKFHLESDARENQNKPRGENINSTH
jgi:hypothetical protein